MICIDMIDYMHHVGVFFGVGAVPDCMHYVTVFLRAGAVEFAVPGLSLDGWHALALTNPNVSTGLLFLPSTA